MKVKLYLSDTWKTSSKVVCGSTFSIHPFQFPSTKTRSFHRDHFEGSGHSISYAKITFNMSGLDASELFTVKDMVFVITGGGTGKSLLTVSLSICN